MELTLTMMAYEKRYQLASQQERLMVASHGKYEEYNAKSIMGCCLSPSNLQAHDRVTMNFTLNLPRVPFFGHSF